MADDIDRAQAREEELRSDALAEHARRPAVDPADWDRASARWCEVCGERIPDARRRAVPGVQHCTECAASIEPRRRGW